VATRTFDGTTDTSWADATNWIGDTKPADGDDVVIDAVCVLDEDTTADTYASLTINASESLDLNDYSLNISGNCKLEDNATLIGGSGTLSVGSDLDWDQVGAIFTPETSTVDLTGTGARATKEDFSDVFYNLKEVPTGTTRSLPSGSYGRVIVNNICTIGGGTYSGASPWITLRKTSGTPLVFEGGGPTAWDGMEIYYKPISAASVNVTGGTYHILEIGSSGGSGIVVEFSVQGNIIVEDLYTTDLYNVNDVLTLSFNGHDMTVGGITQFGTAFQRDVTHNMGSGTFTFGSNWRLGSKSGKTFALNMEGSTVKVAGDIVNDQLGTYVISPGTSELEINGIGAQDIDLEDGAFGHVNVTNVSDKVTFSAGFEAEQFTLAASTTAEFANGETFIVHELDWSGTAVNAVTVTSDSAGNTFALSVDGPVNATYVDVKDCDASGGVQIVDHLGTDSTGNINWLFATDSKVQVNLLLEGADFDPDKLEFHSDCDFAKIQLALLLVEVEYFDTDGDFGPFTEVDTGTNVEVSNGKLKIAGSGAINSNGVYLTSLMAITSPGKMSIKVVPKSSGDNIYMGLAAAAALDHDDDALKLLAQGSSNTIIPFQNGGFDSKDTQLVTDTEYLLEQEWDIDKTMRLYITGGVWTSRTLLATLRCDRITNVGFQINSVNTVPAWEFDDFERYYGHATDDPVVTVAELDSGQAGTDWDMSTFDFPGDDGGLTFSYATGDSSNPTGWSAYKTKTQMQAESDSTARYFRLRVKVSSDGATQREVTIPRMLMEPPTGNGGFPATSQLDGVLQP